MENDDSNYFQENNEFHENNLEEDVYAFTEESVNILNPLKYIENPNYEHLDKNIKIDNLLSDLKNIVNENKANFNSFENELCNINIFKKEFERIKNKKIKNVLRDSHCSLNSNKKIKNKIIDPRLYKLNDDTFRRINKFNFYNNEDNNSEDESHASKVIDSEAKLHQKNKDDKINMYMFANLLKHDEYFNFIFATLILKYCFLDYSKFKSNELKKEFLLNTEKDIKNFKSALKELNEQIECNKDLLNIVTLKSFDLKAQELNGKDMGLVFIKEIVNKYGKLYNASNLYLFNFTKIIYKNPINVNERIYLKWKLMIGRLVTIWEFKSNSGINQKLSIKYLKIKSLLIKLYKRKEKGGMLFKFLEASKDEDLLNLDNIFSLIKGVSEYPRYTFLRESRISIFYDFAIDLSLVYFLIILPIVIVLQFDSLYLNILDQIFNGIYFFNIVRIFRTLVLDNMNIIQKNLWKPFSSNTKDILLYFDIISLLPFDLFKVKGNPDFRPLSYLALRFLVLLRVFRFGRSFKFLDSTKFAIVFRLMKLMGQFILLMHWCGLFLLIVFQDQIYNTPSTWNFDNSCNTHVHDPLNKYSFNCLFTAAIYSGGFFVSGKQISNLDYFSKFFATTQYLYLFSVFLIGQIITATVFSSVSDLIQSMNQAENKFQDIRDNHRITGLYYKFETNVSKDIQMYYDYTWHKHREKIYGMEIFESLSKVLMKRLTKAMIPSYKYLLKDFIFLNKKDNKFINFIINNLNKYIAFPYERLVTQGHVIKGLFILSNGTVYYEDEPRLNKQKRVYDLKTNKANLDPSFKDTVIRKGDIRKDLQGEMTLSKNIINEKLDNISKNKKHKYINDKVIFPLDSLFIKTGRGIQTFYVQNFTDLFLLSVDIFDKELIVNYPNEMYELSKKARIEGLMKLGRDNDLLGIILRPSSRSTGKYFEDNFNNNNMWIEIKRLLPQYKLKAFTLVNKLDFLANTNDSYGIFENGFFQSKAIVQRIKSEDEVNNFLNKFKNSFFK